MKKLLLVSLSALFLCTHCHAQPGSLDPTFGTGGKVVTDFAGMDDFGTSLAIQADGKIILGGFTYNGGNDMALVRYNTDGTPDMSFGNNGKVTTDILNDDNHITAIALQADGKIVAAGDAKTGTYKNFAVVRYLTDGSLDSAFGTNGVVTTPVGSYGSLAYSAAIQPNGKIVLGGFADTTTSNYFALARYNTDGSLDNTFGIGGIVETHVGLTNDQIYSVKVQPDGKIVAGGYSDNGTDEVFALARYLPDGTLDNAFGTGGIVTTPVGTSFAYCQGVALQPDGKILGVGFGFFPLGESVVVRYNPDGTLDNSFGPGGIVSTQVTGINDEGDAVAIQTDGGIVVCGYAHNGTNLDDMLIRYHADGTVDSTFGNNGSVVTTFGTGTEIFLTLGIQADHKIVAAGWSQVNGRDFTLARYDAGPVGIDEPLPFSLSAFVVPSENLLVVHHALKSVDDALISVMDLNGKILFATQPGSPDKTEIGTGGLAAGVYVVRLREKDVVGAVRVVINKP